jgi:hypothetical protein
LYVKIELHLNNNNNKRKDGFSVTSCGSNFLLPERKQNEDLSKDKVAASCREDIFL